MPSWLAVSLGKSRPSGLPFGGGRWLHWSCCLSHGRTCAADAKALLASWRDHARAVGTGDRRLQYRLYLAAQSTTALNIVMLQSTVPVLIVVASFILFRDEVSKRQGLGIAISLAGALTLISHGLPKC